MVGKGGMPQLREYRGADSRSLDNNGFGLFFYRFWAIILLSFGFRVLALPTAPAAVIRLTGHVQHKATSRQLSTPAARES